MNLASSAINCNAWCHKINALSWCLCVLLRWHFILGTRLTFYLQAGIPHRGKVWILNFSNLSFDSAFVGWIFLGNMDTSVAVMNSSQVPTCCGLLTCAIASSPSSVLHITNDACRPTCKTHLAETNKQNNINMIYAIAWACARCNCLFMFNVSDILPV